MFLSPHHLRYLFLLGCFRLFINVSLFCCHQPVPPSPPPFSYFGFTEPASSSFCCSGCSAPSPPSCLAELPLLHALICCSGMSKGVTGWLAHGDRGWGSHCRCSAAPNKLQKSPASRRRELLLPSSSVSTYRTASVSDQNLKLALQFCVILDCIVV